MFKPSPNTKRTQRTISPSFRSRRGGTLAGNYGRPAVVAVLCLLSCTAVVSWAAGRHALLPKRFGCVVPGKIYRSGQIRTWHIADTWQQHDIAVVIDLQLNDYTERHQQAEIQIARELGLEHHRCSLGGDGRGEVQHYADAVTILVQNLRRNRPVVVHCSAGTQRTGGVVACYRLFFEQADPKAVLAEMQAYEWCPVKDRELVDFLDRCLPEIAVLLHRNGTLKQLPESIPRLRNFL